MAFHYLTPAVAQIAVEQIDAWHRDVRKAKAPALLNTEGSNVRFFATVLRNAGIDMRLLEGKGYARSAARGVAPSQGSIETHYVIDMAALKALAAGIYLRPQFITAPSPKP